jgi:hypothetical protein
MPRFRVPPAHDIPIIASFDLEETVRRYRAYLLRGAAEFGYGPARSAAPFALVRSAEFPLQALLKQCALTRPPSGVGPNSQVIRALWDIGGERRFKVYDAPSWHFDFRSDLALAIRADALVVEDGVASLFWMQMRTGNSGLNPRQMGLLGRLFKMEAERRGYPDLGLIVADLGRVEGEKRIHNLLSLDQLDLVPEDDADRKLQLFADAHDELVKAHFDPKAEREARKRRRGGSDHHASFL